MITGRVSPQLEAAIPLTLRGRDGTGATLRVVIDTGFDGSLCLPPDRVEALRLFPLGVQVVLLGDGTEAELGLYQVDVEWHGRLVVAPALEVEGGALLGMALLRGCRLTMDVADGGPVTIEPLGEP